jgi:hypothetical protein
MAGGVVSAFPASAKTRPSPPIHGGRAKTARTRGDAKLDHTKSFTSRGYCFGVARSKVDRLGGIASNCFYMSLVDEPTKHGDGGQSNAGGASLWKVTNIVRGSKECSLLPRTERPVHAVDSNVMEIQFVSSLTPEDEENLAQPLLKLLCAVLDQLPIMYTLRIQTPSGIAFQRTSEFSESEND